MVGLGSVLAAVGVLGAGAVVLLNALVGRGACPHDQAHAFYRLPEAERQATYAAMTLQQRFDLVMFTPHCYTKVFRLRQRFAHQQGEAALPLLEAELRSQDPERVRVASSILADTAAACDCDLSGARGLIALLESHRQAHREAAEALSIIRGRLTCSAEEVRFRELEDL